MNGAPSAVNRDRLSLALSVLGWVCLVPSALLLVIALVAAASGDGFSDAAPWWLFLGLLAVILALPGALLMFVARARAKRSTALPTRAGGSRG